MPPSTLLMLEPRWGGSGERIGLLRWTKPQCSVGVNNARGCWEMPNLLSGLKANMAAVNEEDRSYVLRYFVPLFFFYFYIKLRHRRRHNHHHHYHHQHRNEPLSFRSIKTWSFWSWRCCWCFNIRFGLTLSRHLLGWYQKANVGRRAS
jgi:hypothetical protein